MPFETIVHVKHLSLVRIFISVWSKQHAQRGREGKPGREEEGGVENLQVQNCRNKKYYR